MGSDFVVVVEVVVGSGLTKRLLALEIRGDFPALILAFRIGFGDVFFTGVDLAGSLFRRRGFARAESRSRFGERCLSDFLLTVGEESGVFEFVIDDCEEFTELTRLDFRFCTDAGEGDMLLLGVWGRLGDVRSLHDDDALFALFTERSLDVRVGAGDNDAFKDGGVFTGAREPRLGGRFTTGGVLGAGI